MVLAAKIAGWLLAAGAVLHSYGAISHYAFGTEILIWSLGCSVAAALIAALGLIRLQGRRDDRALALISGLSSLAWVAVGLGFGHAIGNIADPRALWHAGCAAVLAVIAFRDYLRA